MKTYVIEYMSYEGNLRTTEVNADNENCAVMNAYDEESNYSSDNIHKIISVTEE